jgi:hypothetical protein
MFAQFYSGMRWADLPLFALFLFLVTFVAAVVRVTLLTKKADLEPIARLPLDERDERIAARRTRP